MQRLEKGGTLQQTIPLFAVGVSANRNIHLSCIMELPQLAFTGESAMCHYKQLSIEDRENARVLLEKGRNYSEIARELKRSTSTISREFKRNTDNKGIYAAHDAQKKHQKRKRKSGAKQKLQKENVREYVTRGLEKRWSPGRSQDEQN